MAMSPAIMKTLTLLLILLCQSLFAGTPTEALNAFGKAAKEQKFEDAWKHTAQFEGASEEVNNYLKSLVRKVFKLSKEGWSFEILEEKISGDCAVIILNEIKEPGQNGLNIDPAFLIRQNGEWKVMPKLTQWDVSARIPAGQQPASMKLDEKKIAAYQELEKWVDERTEALQKERRKEETKKSK